MVFLQRAMQGSCGCLVGAMIFLMGASMAFAQQSTGTILGTVKDPSGQVVPGAKLTAQNLETGQSAQRRRRTMVPIVYRPFRLAPIPLGRA